MQTHQDADRYKMSHRKRGRCIVFNNEKFKSKELTDRAGSAVDVKRIRKTFGKLRFEVTVHTDWKRDQIEKKIRKLSRPKSGYSDNDCICIFVLTHGGASGELEAFDESYNSKMIWEPFIAEKCPTLAEKPKLFFFEGCRGMKIDWPVKLVDTATNRGEMTEQLTAESESERKPDAISPEYQASERRKIDGHGDKDFGDLDRNLDGMPYKYPSYADFLFAYSSVEEFGAVQNIDDGSWYIQSLCDVLDKHADSQDLVKMLTTTARKIAIEFETELNVDGKMGRVKQVSTYETSLTRDLYFTPNNTNMTRPSLQRRGRQQSVELQGFPEESSTKNTVRISEYDEVSTDQGYGGTPASDPRIIPSQMHQRTDHTDATPPGPNTNVIEEELTVVGTPSEMIARMPVSQESEQYNMSHANAGTCLIFNHDEFEIGCSKRKGSSIDVERIKKTFANLRFEVVIHNNLEHRDVLDEINKLSLADHTGNDCVCVFLLTHGLNNNLVMAKDAIYRADKIWKPFTANLSLAGKPKLFFYQACRGDKSDGGVMVMPPNSNTQTDSAVASYNIPTHSDFLIAHSTVDGFFSWRNPEKGTWYIQSLCTVLDEFAETTDLMRMLTITARKVATEYQSSDDTNPQKNEQKQVPSTKSTLIRDLYFKPKE